MRKKFLFLLGLAAFSLLIGGVVYADIPECTFTSQPTDAQLAACQAASAAAAAASAGAQTGGVVAAPPVTTSSGNTSVATTAEQAEANLNAQGWTLQSELSTGKVVCAFRESCPSVATQQACWAALSAAGGTPPGATFCNGVSTPISGTSSGTSGMPSGEQMGPSGEQMGPPADLEQKINEQKLKGMKSAVKGMESGYKKMKAQYDKLKKQGITIPTDLQQKLDKVREIINTIKNAADASVIENIDPEDYSDLMGALGDSIGQLTEQFQKMKALKSAATGMERGVAMFEKQIAKLNKQGTPVPEDITKTVQQMRDIINGLKSGKSYEELQALGIDDMDALMEKIDNSRNTIEMLLRWPNTAKMMDKQIATMQKTLVRLTTLVNRQKAAGVDLTEELNKYTDGLNKLKDARAKGEQMLKSGDTADAFDTLESDFYDQLNNVIEYQIIIESMANLGRFNSEFKKSIAAEQKVINTLKKKKVDVTEVTAMLNDINAKGNEIVALIKVKPIDANLIADKIAIFQDALQALQDKLDELANNPMPWEVGKAQLGSITIPKALNTYLDENQKLDEKVKPIITASTIQIEAEDESQSYILPLSQRPATNTKEIKPAWRPPYFGTGDWYLAAGGEWLKYNFNVLTAGTYNVWVRDYVDKYQAKGIRRITIDFNGTVLGTFPEVVSDSTDAKGIFGWHKVGTVTLPAGANTMKVTKESTTRGAAVLDAFYLTTGTETPPEK